MNPRRLPVLFLLISSLLLATTAYAGGIVVSLEGEVPAVQAGTPFTVLFTIRSMHDSSLQEGFMPVVLASNPVTGEEIRVQATELNDRGHYAATLTLPSAGEWQWQITPMPDYPNEFVLELTPLQVQPAGATATGAPAGAAPIYSPAALGVLATATLAAALVGLLAVRRRATARV